MAGTINIDVVVTDIIVFPEYECYLCIVIEVPSSTFIVAIWKITNHSPYEKIIMILVAINFDSWREVPLIDKVKAWFTLTNLYEIDEDYYWKKHFFDAWYHSTKAK